MRIYMNVKADSPDIIIESIMVKTKEGNEVRLD